MRQKRMLAAISGTAFVGIFSAVAHAANPEEVAVEVEFVAPITITEQESMRFGLLDVGLTNGAQLALATDDSVSGATIFLLNNAQGAADLTVTATAGAAMNILVDGISPGTGYTLGSFVCDYDAGGTVGPCDAGAGLNVASAAASATLLIGATLTGTGLAVVGDQSGTFDVTVVYQ
jgi:Domain of unknown function (DUF4402)